MFTAQAREELCKGAARNKDLVAQLQKERELLRAIIADLRQTSGDVQSHGSGLCCPLSLASGSSTSLACILMCHQGCMEAQWRHYEWLQSCCFAPAWDCTAQAGSACFSAMIAARCVIAGLSTVGQPKNIRIAALTDSGIVEVRRKITFMSQDELDVYLTRMGVGGLVDVTGDNWDVTTPDVVTNLNGIQDGHVYILEVGAFSVKANGHRH